MVNTEEKIEQGGKVIEKAAKELQVGLPKSREPFIIRVIAFVLLLGGVAQISDVFRFFQPEGKLPFMFLNIGVGTAAVAAAYGIIKRKRWSFWVVAFLAVVGAFTNPPLAVVLAAGLAFLWLHRGHFD